MRDGPVTASFTVFIDFTTYQSGIYRRAQRPNTSRTPQCHYLLPVAASTTA